MRRRKTPPPPGPDATLNELWQWSVKVDQDSWLEPRFRDLLEDAEHFVERTQNQSQPELRARCARAAIVFAAAAVEAASNDALVTVRDLFSDSWPAEYIKDPPWCHFRRLSPNRVDRLIERGKLEQKVRYLIARIEGGVAAIWLGQDFAAKLAILVKMRNRIVHLRSLGQPAKAGAVLNSKQVAHTATSAVETARKYVDSLEEGFREMKLPIALYAPG
ncbi:MAG: hypothetical protein HY527_10360 [Betaproteobacteria bacterium]|nr:hypothetical protein [Betaproteobacteria bacterium]